MYVVYIFDLHYLSKRLGFEVNEKEVIEILNSLGIETDKKENSIKCKIPSWRHDIHGEADISEEIIRIKGYENIPTKNIRSKNKINQNILNRSQKNSIKAKLYYDLRRLNSFNDYGITDLTRYELECWVRWNDRFISPQGRYANSATHERRMSTIMTEFSF